MSSEPAKIIHSRMTDKASSSSDVNHEQDDFLTALSTIQVDKQYLNRELRRCMAELNELQIQKRWEDIISLFHPVEETCPDLYSAGMATRLRSNTAFALGHLQRYDDAITAYSACIAEDDQNFQYHSGLGYTAYDSLYAAMKGKLIFHPMARKNRIELAHKHFTRAQQLRPEGITNYYRQGMLFKQIQKTADKALPLFEKAIANWRGNTDLIPSQNIRY